MIIDVLPPKKNQAQTSIYQKVHTTKEHENSRSSTCFIKHGQKECIIQVFVDEDECFIFFGL